MNKKMGTLGLYRTLVLAYPKRTATVILLQFLASVAEGFGLTSLMPLLGIVVGGDTLPKSQFELKFVELFLQIGIEPSTGMLLCFIVIVMSLKAVFMLLAAREIGYTAAYVAQDLRIIFIKSLMKVKWLHFLTLSIGGLANSITTEAERASTGYRAMCDLIADILQVFIYVIIGVFLSWKATILAVFVGMLSMFVLKRFVTLARKSGVGQTDLMRSVTGNIVEGMHGIKPLRAMAREDRLGPLLEAETRGLNKVQQQNVFSKLGLAHLQEPFVVVAVAIGMYILLSQNTVHFGSLMLLVLIFSRTVQRLGNLQRKFQKITRSESAYWALQNAIDKNKAEVEKNTGTKDPNLKLNLALKEVAFAYDGKDIFKNVSLQISAGDFVTIIGPSGVGKSTIADLVTGLIRPNSGEIYIDNIPLADIDLQKWRSRIGYVPQDAVLFNDSIYNNVTLRDKGLKRDEVVKSLEKSGAMQFIQQLPHGVDSSVGERGGRLSGGQRQRIAIARALVRNPQLLILDEPTSALDPETANEISTTLRNLHGQMTILAISHQDELIRNADKIVRLTENGTQIVDC